MSEIKALPSALERVAEIARRAAAGQLAVFLDYDGTLTPIVARPELATLAPSMRAAVARLAGLCTLAVVSGRDLEDVRRMVGLEGIYYAGSHGFDISGPAGRHLEFQQGLDYLPDLAAAGDDLEAELFAVPGTLVERKRFAVAVHFRQVDPQRFAEVEQAVERVHTRYPRLRRTGGKMINELRPGIAWDKGKAVAWLLGELELGGSGVTPVFLGDDVTDEDAFRELRAGGIGILVCDQPRPSQARYALKDTDEVGIFLEKLATELERSRGQARPS